MKGLSYGTIGRNVGNMVPSSKYGFVIFIHTQISVEIGARVITRVTIARALTGDQDWQVISIDAIKPKDGAALGRTIRVAVALIGAVPAVKPRGRCK